MTHDAIVEKNKYGFHSATNRPVQDELEEYYKKKYYQTAQGSYSLEYAPEEIRHFFNKIEEKVTIVNRFHPLDQTSSVIDIGCGEGWVLSYFKKKNISATGLDYSSFGCQKFNHHCIENFQEGDIYANLNKIIKEGRQFDLVWLDNVLEHVIDPLELLHDCRKILKKGGVLMIEVPNDFSVLQTHAFDKSYIDKKYWIAYPDHLSYFNRKGLANLASAADLTEVFSIGDFPIDLNLINPDTNYSRDKTKGRNCYKTKYEFENLIHDLSVEKAIDLYRALMELGIGRCITSFFVKREGE